MQRTDTRSVQESGWFFFVFNEKRDRERERESGKGRSMLAEKASPLISFSQLGDQRLNGNPAAMVQSIAWSAPHG